MSKYLESALDAAARGYHVWPCARDGKNPYVKSFKGDPDFGLTDPKKIKGRQWNYGVCIMLGPGQYVLDADTADAVPAVEKYDTLRVRTKRGMHAYFTLPEGITLRQGSRVGENIDGKGVASTGTRSVVVWAGEHREIVNDVPPAELPADWIKSIGQSASWDSDAVDPTPAQEARWRAAWESWRDSPSGVDAQAQMGRMALARVRRRDTTSTNDLYRGSVGLGRAVARGEIAYEDAYVNVVSLYTGTYKNIKRSTRRALTRGAYLEDVDMGEDT